MGSRRKDRGAIPIHPLAKKEHARGRMTLLTVGHFGAQRRLDSGSGVVCFDLKKYVVLHYYLVWERA